MQLMSHQIYALEQTKGFKKVLYGLDMGLGKTFVGSEKMARLNNKLNIVICQKSKIDDWINHFKTYYNIPVYDGSKKKQLEEFISKQVGVLVINYDLVFRRAELSHLYNFTLMLDESSMISNSKAKRTKFILKLYYDNVILLSGTVCNGKYENLWSQYHLLGGSLSQTRFNANYVNFVPLITHNGVAKDFRGFPIKIVDKNNPYKNEKTLFRELATLGAIFMKSEDVLDLPSQTFIDVRVKASKEYKEFIKDSLLIKDGIEYVGNNPMSKFLYSRMISSIFNDAKIQAFVDLIESTSDRIIVFYNFNAERALLKDLCKDRPISEVNGHIKDLTNYDNESTSITLVQYQSGAMGLNLQKANKLIYYSPSCSSDLYEQSKKRLHRIGTTKSCFYYRLISSPIEDSIYKTLEKRQSYTQALFDYDIGVI